MVETLRLGDHCEKIGSGATPRGGKDSYSQCGPVTLIRSQNVHNDRFYHPGLARISHEQAAQLQNVEVKHGDILLNITGDSVARACQVDMEVLPARVNQHVAIIRPKPDEIEPRFLRYYLVTPYMQSQMLGLAAAGATRDALTKSMVEDFRIPAFDIGTQRAIACVLGALDDKIEENRRTNKTLEAIARIVFLDWFVDFGPTRAKMEDRAPYLSNEIWSLFPDHLADGGIPDGWAMRSLRDLADILSGGTPSKAVSSMWNGDIPWISPKVMADIHVSGSEDRVTASAIGNGTRIAPNGSTLLMVRGMGLHQGVRISQARRDVAFNQDVKAFVPKDVEPSLLLFAMLSIAPSLFERVESSGHGTGKLPTEVIESCQFAIPPPCVRTRLASYIDNINERIASSVAEAESLASILDLLLPKLMSGEIRIKDAEKMVGEAT